MDLGDYMKDTYGIEAAAGGGVMMAAGSGEGRRRCGRRRARLSSTSSSRAPARKKIQVIKAVREATGLGLKEAKAVCDNARQAHQGGISKEDAEELAKNLKEARRRGRDQPNVGPYHPC